MAVYSSCEVNLVKWNKILITCLPCAAFPNVTVAPDSSQGPILVNQDPVTQAILSESVVEPQVMCSAHSHDAHAEIKFK